MTAADRDEIRIEHLPNTSLQSYRYTSLLDYFLLECDVV
jgi:hypothetical protein